MYPKARGLPGFIRTRQKEISPSAARTFLTTSKSPTETPPEVINKSAPCAKPARILAVRSSSVSCAIPNINGTPPYLSTCAAFE
jgi:hypothetical protein